ncbi:sodium/glutamate symporter [Acidaminococcus sp.]|uniref:Sodium/glutamate symporter n=1 Tax=Acidaminococcus intestini TaxID=187327 RepID=A0A943EDZ4_9FIRM|nr:sodium/glutamate symporter [Acidaminococcus sp.]MBS5520467.1 sodium/glutamate symporter [Acidaminococcus intestini]MDY2738597.1 sodium/glutamate symporter [Acidaminococcus sp.]
MTIKFDLIQTMGLAVIVYLLGMHIKSKVAFLRKYFIPAPVIGGLIASILIFIGIQTGTYKITMTTTLQNYFMNLFFCTTGFTCSIAIIKKSGKLGAILAVGAVFFLVVQNIVGVSLAGIFGINKLLGIAMGSISMSGGVGSGAAFGPTLEKLGADGGTTIGVAAATFGLLMGSIVGGPVAEMLISKYSLKSSFKEGSGTSDVETKSTISEKHYFMSLILVICAAAVGSYIHALLIKATGLTFPYYVGCLFGGMLFRNVMDKKNLSLNMKEIDLIGSVSLNLFLSLALMNLNIAKLVGLAGPMIVILLVQCVVMMLWSYFVTFRTMGKNYEAAVMAAGHCGVGLGQTPNAVANMAAVIEKNGPAPNAWFILPVITVVFINIMNPIIITTFINLFK